MCSRRGRPNISSHSRFCCMNKAPHSATEHNACLAMAMSLQWPASTPGLTAHCSAYAQPEHLSSQMSQSVAGMAVRPVTSLVETGRPAVVGGMRSCVHYDLHRFVYLLESGWRHRPSRVSQPSCKRHFVKVLRTVGLSPCGGQRNNTQEQGCNVTN